MKMKLLCIILAWAVLPTLPAHRQTKVALWSVRCPVKKHSNVLQGCLNYLAIWKKEKLHTGRVAKFSQPLTHPMDYSSCLHSELTFLSPLQNCCFHNIPKIIIFEYCKPWEVRKGLMELKGLYRKGHGNWSLSDSPESLWLNWTDLW